MYNNNENKKLMTEEERKYREERQLKAMVECNLLTVGCITTATVARRIGMTATALYQKLKEHGILFKSDGIWMLMPKYTGMGLLRYRYIPYYTMLGERKVRVYPVWTREGIEFLTTTFGIN